MQVRQTFMSRTQQEKEDWLQYLDALEGLAEGFLISLLPPGVMKSSSASSMVSGKSN